MTTNTPITQEHVDDIKLVMELAKFTPDQRAYIFNAIASGATLKNVLDVLKANPHIERLHIQEEPHGLY